MGQIKIGEHAGDDRGRSRTLELRYKFMCLDMKIMSGGQMMTISDREFEDESSFFGISCGTPASENIVGADKAGEVIDGPKVGEQFLEQGPSAFVTFRKGELGHMENGVTQLQHGADVRRTGS